MPTVREALNKISELKSRWAVLNELVVYLDTHYKKSDAGPPELRITRDDYATVPEEHINLQIDHISQQMDQITAEVDEWEKLTISVDSVDEEEDKPAAPPVRKNGVKRRRGLRAAQSKRQDQPTADSGEQEGSGQPS